MNSLTIEGTLTKAIYRSEKGWAAFTLSVPKKGSSFSVWVPVYVPSDVAASIESLKMGAKSVLVVEGELDQKKDKTLQVKAKSIKVKPWDAGTEITDEDIPEF